GVRPTINTGKADPSQEARDHVIWDEDGLITVTGGKLTTYHAVALSVLRIAAKHLPEMKAVPASAPLDPVSVSCPEAVSEAVFRRLCGRYGNCVSDVIGAARDVGELEPIADTPYLWVELRWAARSEYVVHLDDLLLRRVRLGLLAENGGLPLMDRIMAICERELGWGRERFESEIAAYAALWNRAYSLPPRELIPDWRTVRP
ncbi:MAG TPA: glycerol-3-phosphate dehydrogenase C-terminal domain-containing protein, partial [Aggregatilineales bacterium]|nr:glycerol-3-phosphate dehydrogenase C-terminal domain-containing protein [Aggregatilineales bacterium]